MNNPFTRTRAALAEYDSGEPARRAVWYGEFATDADDFRAEAADKAALDKVRAAFYQDTKEINSHENCMRVDLGFMRQCAARAEKDGL